MGIEECGGGQGPQAAGAGTEVCAYGTAVILDAILDKG